MPGATPRGSPWKALGELAAIVLDQAHALHHHVVDHPLVALDHDVVDGDVLVLHHHLGADEGLVALDLLLQVVDLLVVVFLKLEDVRLLQQLGKAGNEFILLLGVVLLPILTQGAAGKLVPVKKAISHGTQLLLAFLPLGRALERGVGQDGDDLVNADLETILRLAGAGRSREGEKAQHPEKKSCFFHSTSPNEI
jgi:hypothetical protein